MRKIVRKGNSDIAAGCVLVVIVGFLLMLCMGGCYGLSKFETSDGVRDSTIRKISNSGIFFKTCEVEALGDGIRFKDGSASPETFHYTVRSLTAINKVQNLQVGQKVRIHYRKYLTRWYPSGESHYELVDVE